MGRPRDNQRKRVLEAEGEYIKASGYLDDITDVQVLAKKVSRSAWLAKQDTKYGKLLPIRVFSTDTQTICHQTEPPWYLQRCTTVDFLHELAHHMQPANSQLHGPEFCKAFLEAVRRWLGPEEKKALYQIMRKHRVKTRVLSPEGKEALAANAVKARSKFVKEDLQALLDELSNKPDPFS